MKIVLLHDEILPTAREDEVDALVQAEAIAGALAELGHTSVPLAFSADLDKAADELRRLAADMVFNLVESVGGRGCLIHLAPALLDALDVPYTGAPTEAVFLTSQKLLAKRILQAHEIATPAWMTVAASPETELPLPGRYIVKSVWEHASVGMEDDAIVEVDRADTLRQKLRSSTGRGRGEVFAEAFVAGREFNLALLAGSDGPEVLPPAEIHFVDYPDDKPKVVGYRAKWAVDSFEYHHTPRCFDFPASDRGLLDELCGIARKCWELFGLRGYARVDFRVDAAGRPWVLEINTNPCLSADAGYPAVAQRGGLSLMQVVQRIVDDAQRRFGALDPCGWSAAQEAAT